ncbi:hypothetical protein CR513_05322, partial [Mucuna pruriens]
MNTHGRQVEISIKSFCFLKCTLDFDLFYSPNVFKFMEFCESDFAKNANDRRSTIGISFVSFFRVTIVRTLIPIKYVVTISCTCHTIQLRRPLKKFNMKQDYKDLY